MHVNCDPVSFLFLGFNHRFKQIGLPSRICFIIGYDDDEEKSYEECDADYYSGKCKDDVIGGDFNIGAGHRKEVANNKFAKILLIDSTFITGMVMEIG